VVIEVADENSTRGRRGDVAGEMLAAEGDNTIGTSALIEWLLRLSCWCCCCSCWNKGEERE